MHHITLSHQELDMKFGVFGTGMVGIAIADRLIELGHEVRMGARSATNEKAVAWAEAAGERASCGDFASAASFGEIVFNCTLGAASLEVVRAANVDGALGGKILVDVSNPLDFSKGMPPTLFISNDDSLAEQLQRALPETRVVKALNTMNSDLMVRPDLLPEPHDTFISGDDADAKARVVEVLRAFGWPQVIDLGGLSTARGTESFLPLWIRLWGVMRTPTFNVKIVKVG
jgi:predicted dinucleotide-binding enzyme